MMKCIRLLCRIQCRRGFSSASKIDSSVSTQSCSKVEPAERIPLKKNIEDIFNEKKKEIAVIGNYYWIELTSSQCTFKDITDQNSQWFWGGCVIHFLLM